MGIRIGRVAAVPETAASRLAAAWLRWVETRMHRRQAARGAKWLGVGGCRGAWREIWQMDGLKRPHLWPFVAAILPSASLIEVFNRVGYILKRYYKPNNYLRITP